MTEEQAKKFFIAGARLYSDTTDCESLWETHKHTIMWAVNTAGADVLTPPRKAMKVSKLGCTGFNERM